MFSAIGKRVKAASPAAHAHIMGYANGYFGYFPERKAYAEGGYEVATSHLDPAAEEIFLGAVAELMKRFYRAMLHERKSPAAALRAAQRALAGTPRWSAPYYWAGWVIQGEWR